MIRWFALIFFCLCQPSFAQSALAQAERAAALIEQAATALEQASNNESRLSALGRVVQGYELGLAAQRSAERDLRLRIDVVGTEVSRERGRLARILGGLHRIAQTPVPLLMLHPQGPEGAARAAQMIGGIVPQLQAEADTLRAMMIELDLLANEQSRAELVMREGLEGVQFARAALQDALAGRSAPAVTPDRELLSRLRTDSTNLQAFARALARQSGTLTGPDSARFELARGTLPLPIAGQIKRAYGAEDDSGITRPGIVLAVDDLYQVTSPWTATLRYTGPFLEYGGIVVLEPAQGYLMIIAGLEDVQRTAGEVVAAGEPLGLLTGSRQAETGFLVEQSGDSGANRPGELYIELRQRGVPIDPTPWFVFD